MVIAPNHPSLQSSTTDGYERAMLHFNYIKPSKFLKTGCTLHMPQQMIRLLITLMYVTDIQSSN